MNKKLISLAVISSLMAQGLLMTTTHAKVSMGINIFQRQITKLPDASDLKWYNVPTLNSDDFMLTYSGITSEEKQKLTQDERKVFEKAEAKYKELQQKKKEIVAQYSNKLEKFSELLQKLPIATDTVTLETKDTILEAKNMFDSLSEDEKSQFDTEKNIAQISERLTLFSEKIEVLEKEIDFVVNAFKDLASRIPAIATKEDKQKLEDEFEDAKYNFENLALTDRAAVSQKIGTPSINEIEAKIAAITVSQTAKPVADKAEKTQSDKKADNSKTESKNTSGSTFSSAFHKTPLIKKEETKKEETMKTLKETDAKYEELVKLFPLTADYIAKKDVNITEALKKENINTLQKVHALLLGNFSKETTENPDFIKFKNDFVNAFDKRESQMYAQKFNIAETDIEKIKQKMKSISNMFTKNQRKVFLEKINNTPRVQMAIKTNPKVAFAIAYYNDIYTAYQLNTADIKFDINK